MSKKAPVKKSRRRLKRSIRRSLAAVLMITAIGVAAIPVPENAAATEEDQPMTVAVDIDSYPQQYTTIGALDQPSGSVVYSLDIYNGGLYWQYKIDSGSNKVIEYNDSYPATSLTLSQTVPTSYKYVLLTEFQEFQANVFTLSYSDQGVLSGTISGTLSTNQDLSTIQDFFNTYFATDQEYIDFMNSQSEEEHVATSITRTVSRLGDEDQRIYYCKQVLGLDDFVLRPVSNQIKATEQDILDQISLEGRKIEAGARIYIPQYTGTNQDISTPMDEKGYLLAYVGEKPTNTQRIDAIGKYAFADRGVLQYIELPEWLQEIGEGAFMDCTYLSSVSIPFLKIVPDAAFRNCASLQTVNWWTEGGSSGLQEIGVEAFFGAGIVESTNGQGLLKFPIGIKTIKDAAFYGCGSLRQIEFESPNQSTGVEIHKYAFYDNSSLSSVTFNSKVVTKLEDYCFAMGLYSNAMGTFTFPNYSFTTGKKILANRTNMTQIVVPENVTNLGGQGEESLDILGGCTGLQVATFQGTGTNYHKSLFNAASEDFYVTGPARMNTTATKDDVKDASNPRRSTWDADKTDEGNYIPYLYKIGGREYYEICSGEGYLESIDKNSGILISCDLKDENATVTNGELVIPDKVGNTDVVGIASDCFKGKDKLAKSVETLVVGNNIRQIEDSVFKSWTNLTEVELGKSIQTIGKEAFADCTSLTDITFATPNNYDYGALAPIGTNAFATKSGKLTIHGDIAEGYAPYVYAMSLDNYVENSVAVGSSTKRRILYQSRWDSPSYKHMSLIYGDYDDGNSYVTLIDYPLYQDFFDEDGGANLSADLEQHNRDVEKQYYNAYGNYTYPTEEDLYLEKKVRFAVEYYKASDPKSLYESIDPSTGYYGPWINPSFCASYSPEPGNQWLDQKWLDKFGLSLTSSNTVLDWLVEPLVVQAASGSPIPFFEYKEGDKDYSYNFLKNYLAADGDMSNITVNYIDGWTIDEQDMVEAVEKIVVPAGVESIDIKEYFYAAKPGQQNVASNQDNYITYFGQNSDTPRNGIFVYEVDRDNAGLFSGMIDDLYTDDDRTKLGKDTLDKDGMDSSNKQYSHKKGNDRIKVVDMSQSSIVNIPDYAFDDCELLKEVYLPESCKTTGKLPFKECYELQTLTSLSEDVPAQNGILYQKKEDASYELVECILAKGLRTDNAIVAGTSMISAEYDDPYISMISSIGESAFENCENITSVNLSSIDNGASVNKLKAIPNNCFRNCDALLSVELPQVTQDVGQYAFADIRDDYYYVKESMEPRLVITIRGTEFNFATTAFDPKGNGTKDHELSTIDMVTVWTYEDSAAERYVLEQQRLGYDIRLGNEGPEHDNHQYLGKVKRVDFWDWNADVLCNTIYLGENDDRINEESIPEEVVATVTAADHRPGYRFTGWRGEGGLKIGDPIPGDSVTYVAQYASDGTMVDGKFVVDFLDGIDGSLLRGYGAQGDGKYYVEAGTSFAENDLEAPYTMAHPGYEFLQWSNDWTEETKINSSMTILALYGPDGSSSNTPGGSTTGSGGSTQNPSGNASNTTSGSTSSTSSSSTSSGSSTSATSTTADAAGQYTLLVINGSGSGNYAAGTTVIITANTPATGQVFSRWTTETEGVTFTSSSLSATTFVMPASNATVTAEFVSGSGAAPASTAGGGGTGGTGTPVSSTNNGSTRVDITKPGISNKDLATATVNGSTDNFVVKISETPEATQAVANALTSKYGSLDSILYYAMDISLYDSTGTTKIPDITGLTVDITIPIPDALVAYGGNNMAGAVVSDQIATDQLEDLGVRFSTINGVPCVSFTATHFSPYTIYVDTSNLAAGMLDVTPKTGDPIHPKWFLSIGLACLSIILFIKKDKKVVLKNA